MAKLKEEVFYYLDDDRTEIEKTYQADFIDNLSTKNNKIIPAADPADKEIARTLPHIIRTLSFPDGWYVKYTDNVGSHAFFETKCTLVTVHGCPGYYHDWIRLEKCLGPNFCRFVNFFIPGFDNETEMRGNYSGSVNDLSLLLIRLLDHLKIDKFVLLFHSLGGYFSYYFSNNYSHRLQGLIYMAAPPYSWYVGYKTFYCNLNVHNGFNLKKPRTKANGEVINSFK